jgi:hypothetical protein
MPDIVARLAALTLAFVWGWAGLAKVLRGSVWRRALTGYGLRPPVEATARLLVPGAELAVALVLLSGGERTGAALSVALLAGASVLVMRARSQGGDEVPCGCFGGSRARDFRVLLLRNGTLGILAAVVLLGPPIPALFDGVRMPEPAESLAAVLVVIGLGTGVWLLRRATFLLRRDRW